MHCSPKPSLRQSAHPLGRALSSFLNLYWSGVVVRCWLPMESLMAASSAFISCTSVTRLGFACFCGWFVSPPPSWCLLGRGYFSFKWYRVCTCGKPTKWTKFLLTAPFRFSSSSSTVTWVFWRYGFNSNLILSLGRPVSNECESMLWTSLGSYFKSDSASCEANSTFRLRSRRRTKKS